MKVSGTRYDTAKTTDIEMFSFPGSKVIAFTMEAKNSSGKAFDDGY